MLMIAAAGTLATKTQELILGAATPCAQAPPGLQVYADQITGWVKWGVLICLAIGFFVSLGAMLYGRFASNGRAADKGSSGLMVCLLVAVLFVAGWAILSSIVGNGC